MVVELVYFRTIPHRDAKDYCTKVQNRAGQSYTPVY
jgi:hypothetical protein